jgi:hypothetical protein
MRRQAHWVGVIATLMVMAGLTVVPAASARRVSARPQVTASAASVPTLGLRVVRFTEGFGRVRPSTVSYGGDPTSDVGRVRWNSWGGARAVGHGIADWVWPGWCVACGSVSLPATVVAFGLRTCAGHPAYSHVEWYFPSRGMTFSTRLGTENVCDPNAAAHVREPPHAHCDSAKTPGAFVDQIQVFGYGVRCPAARGLVGHLDLLRYFGHNARFQVGSWWCGTELSMQIGARGTQGVECQSGDYNDVSFSVAPTD